MRCAGIAVTVALGALVPLAPPAAADTFTVDSFKDGNDATSADDICATVAGECTLRAAIDAANQGPPDDEIILPKGTFRLKLAKVPAGGNEEGDLNVTQPVEINGRGPGKTVIEQTVKDRVLRSDAPFASFTAPGLRLNDLALTGGVIGGAGENGGAGLQNNAFALLDNVVIRGNVARSDAFDDVPGGGVWTSGILGMAQTTVRDNLALGKGESSPRAAGINVQDGGVTIQDGSKVVRNDVKIRDPEGTIVADAGGILVRNPGMEPADTVSIIDSTVAGNSALGGPLASAGGISAGPFTNLEITRSTISKNRSKKGGGLYAVGVGSALVTNSTISGNSDTGQGGAAIFYQAETDAISIESTTIADNEPTAGHFSVEAGEQAAPDSLSLFASIVFDPGKECGDDEASVASDGRNVVGDKTCAVDETLFDLKADPKLGPLADNGGPTKTHALNPSSPAIDRVPCSPGIDQRGLPRPQRTDCDSGSYERKF
jgi:CSLREA domain-containing protein